MHARRTYLTALLALATAAAAFGGDVPRDQVSAAARWLVHLDIERLAKTQFSACLSDPAAGNTRFVAGLARYREMLGVDPLKDLYHLALYGCEASGDRGVALLAGRLNQAAIRKRLATHPAYSERPLGARVICQWQDPASRHPLYACFHSARLLVLSSDQALLGDALAVLDARKPSLASGRPLLTLPVEPAGTFLIGAMRGYSDMPGQPIQALILRNSESGSLLLGENHGAVAAHLGVVAINPEAAEQIKQILNGLVLSAGLSDDATGLARLVGRSQISSNNRTVEMRVQCPAREAAQMLNALLPAP